MRLLPLNLPGMLHYSVFKVNTFSWSESDKTKRPHLREQKLCWSSQQPSSKRTRAETQQTQGEAAARPPHSAPTQTSPAPTLGSLRPVQSQGSASQRGERRPSVRPPASRRPQRSTAACTARSTLASAEAKQGGDSPSSQCTWMEIGRAHV